MNTAIGLGMVGNVTPSSSSSKKDLKQKEENLEPLRRILRVLVFNHFNPKSPSEFTQTTNISHSRDSFSKHSKNSLGIQTSNANENKIMGGNKNDPFRLEEMSSHMGISLTIVKQEFEILFRQGKKVTLPSTLKEDRERTSTHLYRE